MEITFRNTVIRLIIGDITGQDTDAVVNAANSSLMGGGGVDGAIHRAGGPRIKEECLRIRRNEWPDGLPPGKSVMTGAGDLPSKYVIHTVGPIWRGGGRNEESTLASCYRGSLSLAESMGIKSISFPSISTGAYGYPVKEASETALKTIRRHLETGGSHMSEIRFVLFSSSDLEIYSRTARVVLS